MAQIEGAAAAAVVGGTGGAISAVTAGTTTAAAESIISADAPGDYLTIGHPIPSYVANKEDIVVRVFKTSSTDPNIGNMKFEYGTIEVKVKKN
jgi:hypothetical protein